jgi:tetratricopeptide (TPR) repeat protein
LGEEPIVATVLSNLALIARGRGDWPRAQSLYERAIALTQRIGDPVGLAGLYNGLGKTYLLMGRHDDATACCSTALAIAERAGDDRLMAAAWYQLAFVYEGRGLLDRAVAMMERVVEVDEKYRLPKLEENRRRLREWRNRLAGAANIT